MPIQAPQVNTNWLNSVGAQWAGEQQRAAMNESDTQQDWTRAQTAKSMQDQDIARQKLPGELEQQGATLESTRANTEGTVSQTKERNQKLDQTKYTAFANDLSVFQPTQDNLADSVRLAEIAKKHGMDTADPRIQATIEMLKQGPEMFAKFQQQLAENTPEARRKKADDQRLSERQEANAAASEKRALAVQEARDTAAMQRTVLTLQNSLEKIKAQAAQTNNQNLNQLVAEKVKEVQTIMSSNLPNEQKAIALQQAEANLQQAYATLVQVEGVKAQQAQVGRPNVGAITNLPTNPPISTVAPGNTGAQPAAGGGDIAARVQAAGQKYEPEKYDYRIGPNGEVQRKAK